jgi:hypothetical protein
MRSDGSGRFTPATMRRQPKLRTTRAARELAREVTMAMMNLQTLSLRYYVIFQLIQSFGFMAARTPPSPPPPILPLVGVVQAWCVV